MKGFKKFVLSVLALFAVAMLLPCAGALAEPTSGDIAITSPNGDTRIYNGTEWVANPYSTGNYYAVTGTHNLGDSVNSIKTSGDIANAGTSITFTGVRAIDAGTDPLTATSISGGIDIRNTGWIGAINQKSNNDSSKAASLDLQGIGDIYVKSFGSSYDSYGAKGIGVYSGKSLNEKLNVSAKSLTVEADGTAYGIHGSLAGRDTTINIANAVTVKGVGEKGIAYGLLLRPL